MSSLSATRFLRSVSPTRLLNLFPPTDSLPICSFYDRAWSETSILWGRPPGAPFLLHDLAHKDVELSVSLFAHFGDLVWPLFIAVHFGSLPRWHVTGRKFDNDTRRRTPTEVQHLLRQLRAGT